jgi:hypothetical protein
MIGESLVDSLTAFPHTPEVEDGPPVSRCKLRTVSGTDDPQLEAIAQNILGTKELPAADNDIVDRAKRVEAQKSLDAFGISTRSFRRFIISTRRARSIPRAGD